MSPSNLHLKPDWEAAVKGDEKQDENNLGERIQQDKNKAKVEKKHLKSERNLRRI